MFLQITRPDDWHLHLRDGEALSAVVPATAARFARAIVMPNLTPPITTAEAALAYRERIRAAVPTEHDFEPLMTLYLTDATTPDEICAARDAGVIAAKLYPANATTNAAAGVTRVNALDPVFAALDSCGMPLLVHGEVTDPEVDVFDREAVFIDRVLAPLHKRLPQLRIVLEHVTTIQGVRFVADGASALGATVTPQHLLLDRNALFAGGLRPHNFCLPVLKRSSHRAALLEAVTGGHERFFLGTDSAPHSRAAKEADCGCAGVYSAPAGIELYAEIFERAGAMDRLEAFASYNGPDFYGLPRNTGSLTLTRKDWTIPSSLPFGPDHEIVPFMAGRTLRWQMGAST